MRIYLLLALLISATTAFSFGLPDFNSWSFFRQVPIDNRCNCEEFMGKVKEFYGQPSVESLGNLCEKTIDNLSEKKRICSNLEENGNSIRKMLEKGKTAEEICAYHNICKKIGKPQMTHKPSKPIGEDSGRSAIERKPIKGTPTKKTGKPGKGSPKPPKHTIPTMVPHGHSKPAKPSVPSHSKPGGNSTGAPTIPSAMPRKPEEPSK